MGPGVITWVGTHGGLVGSGYTTPPVVLVPYRWGGQNGPGAGSAVLQVRISGGSITGVDVIDGGSGYWGTGVSCWFEPRYNANCSVTVRGSITGIELTNRGRGYKAPPNITITRVGGNGAGAQARAVMRGKTGNSQVENLFWGRQTLYGKELLIEIAAEE